MSILQAIIIAIIEGITEFLPISSTGHMIMVSSLMKIQGDFVKTYEIAIQLGAILAIVFLYARRFLTGYKIYYKLFVAFVPTAIVGLFLYKIIKDLLFNSTVVAISLIVGGIVLVLIDNLIVKKEQRVKDIADLDYKNAFFIGLIQCFSMIPGVSRAAATIIGGVFNGLNKKQAMEFSFLLAVPTMAAATGLDLLKTDINFDSYQMLLLGIGFVVSFIVAFVSVKLFIKFVEQYGFKFFGYYRIVIGILFFVIMYIINK